MRIILINSFLGMINFMRIFLNNYIKTYEYLKAYLFQRLTYFENLLFINY